MTRPAHGPPIPARTLGRCLAPGAQGRHVYGTPDPATGITTCDCGACTRRPATSPLAGFCARLFPDGVHTLADLAHACGIPLETVLETHP